MCNFKNFLESQFWFHLRVDVKNVTHLKSMQCYKCLEKRSWKNIYCYHINDQMQYNSVKRVPTSNIKDYITLDNLNDIKFMIIFCWSKSKKLRNANADQAWILSRNTKFWMLQTTAFFITKTQPFRW